MRLILLVVAVVLFVLAALVLFGEIGDLKPLALIAAGLAFFAASFFPMGP